MGGRLEQQDNEQKILGVRWNYVQDELLFDLNELAILISTIEPTKRHIVGVTAKFYDPLGFVSPVIVRFKILFQELCSSKVDWDVPLSGHLLDKWRALVSGFQGITTSIPRCYFTLLDKASSRCSLQGFCDASSAAYAAVVYLRIEGSAGTVANFVASKTRVAPTSKLSIPRLELLSSLLLANLISNISAALTTEFLLQEPCCYTDSKVALYWIRGTTKEWKPFVENRVNEVRRLVLSEYWKHCPGQENPADLPSRGIAPTELVTSKLWRHGPDWLVDTRFIIEEEELCMPEECAKEVRVTHCYLACNSSTWDLCNIGKLVDCEKFSQMRRLLRVTAYVIKFANLFKVKGNNMDNGMELTTSELMRAEDLWVKESQGSLLQHKSFRAWEQQFHLFLDSGVWRCKGRIDNAQVPYCTRYPALLDKEHRFTQLVVENAHKRVLHNGVKETLTEIRSKFWIARGRQFVRQVLLNCTVCHKTECKPYPVPPAPPASPLPDFRVREAPAFSYTGVDLAGPLYIKDKGINTNNKVWICLYTCCVTRAVHLEIVPRMTAEAFIRSFKRFTARRGFPVMMISDNAKTFKSAAKMVRSVIDDREVQQYLTGLKTEWVFNLERAPWWGGIFERMVKSTKRCLKKTIGKAKLAYDELLTALTEVEMILNSRPLSYVSTEDIEEPLTPSHLMTGRRLLSLPDAVHYRRPTEDSEFRVDVCHETVNQRMRHLNCTLNHFWRRWRTEYLLQLRECHSYDKSGVKNREPKVGEVVLLRSDSKLRGLWKLARVQQILRSRDGQVRGAVLQLPSGESGSNILRRPLQYLYPLEVDCNRDDTAESGMNVLETDRRIDETPNTGSDLAVQQVRTPNTNRPKRAAARKANEFIRAVMSDDTD